MQIFRIIVFLFLLNSINLANSPDNKNIILEFSTGANAGWWVFNKGRAETDLGRDQTSLALFVPIQLNMLYSIDRLNFGIGINYSFMLKQDMKESANSGLYPIEKRYVTLKKIALISEYDVYRSKTYTLSPHLKFGWFDINTIHPDKNNFKNKTFWEFGITNEISFSSFNFIIRPIYNHAFINSESGDIKNREHNFYNIGLLLGLRFLLF